MIASRNLKVANAAESKAARDGSAARRTRSGARHRGAERRHRAVRGRRGRRSKRPAESARAAIASGAALAKLDQFVRSRATSWIGAAYICTWIGICCAAMRTIWAMRGAPWRHCRSPALPYRKIFGQGFLTNVLNPKVAIFFLAFVPQFIDADAPNKAAGLHRPRLHFQFQRHAWWCPGAVFTARPAHASSSSPPCRSG
jgi:hypothetical protein